MNIEQQIRQVRALVNNLMILKKNTEATPYLKGQHILGTFHHTEKVARAYRNGIVPDEVAVHLLNQNIALLNKMLKTANELISGERIWIGNPQHWCLNCRKSRRKRLGRFGIAFKKAS